jgi:ribosomal subunit interface protein
MTLRISGKHMDVGEALTTRIEERITDAVEKYFGHGFSGRVTLEKDGAFFNADCMIHLDSGVVLQASARGTEPTTSFDQAAERVEKRLRRYTRKLKSRKPVGNKAAAYDLPYSVMGLPPEDEEVSEDFAPAVIAESTQQVESSSVAEAVMQLELMDEPVHVFRNAGSGAVNVVYRRADGNVGWIDPATVSGGSN